MKKIESANAPAALGPYSQGIIHGETVFLSGQLGIDPESGNMHDALEDQTHQIFKNIESVLKEAGATLNDIVKVTVLLADINDFAAVNEIYGTYFKEPYPARSAFAVKDLPAGGKIEIEVIASLAK